MSKPVLSRSPRIIQSVFVLLLLALFACLSTFLVTIGAQIYRHSVESAEDNNNSRVMTAVVRSAVSIPSTTIRRPLRPEVIPQWIP